MTSVKAVALALFGLFVGSVAQAQHNPRHWDVADKVLLGGYATALAFDVGQTHYALAHDPTLQESNFLGPRPSDGLLIAYGFAALGGVTKVASILPSNPWRKLFLGAFIAYEATTVRNNVRLGASIHLW